MQGRKPAHSTMVDNLTSRYGQLNIAAQDDGFQQTPSRKKRASVTFHPNTLQDKNSQRYPQGPPGREVLKTNQSRPGGTADSGSTPNNPWKANQGPPSKAASYAMDVAEAFKRWGVRVTNALTLVTSTSVSAFQPSKPGYCANMSYLSFHLGDILWAPWVVPCLDPQAISAEDSHSQDNFVYSASTGPITSKMRPLICSGIYKTHLVCYPICTSGGNGLANKPDYQKALALPLLMTRAEKRNSIRDCYDKALTARREGDAATEALLATSLDAIELTRSADTCASCRKFRPHTAVEEWACERMRFEH